MADRAFARAMRRKTQWAGLGSQAGAGTIPISQAAAGGATVILSTAMIIGGAAGLLDEEVTITRLIGQISAVVDLDSADTEGSFAIGCYVTRAEAIAAGVASLPNPETDPDAEWLYYIAGLVRNAAVATKDELSSMRQAFDVRGQRKVRSGETLVWLLSARTAAVRAAVQGRYLVKLA